MADLPPKASRRKSNEHLDTTKKDARQVQDGDVVGVFFSLWQVDESVDGSPVQPLQASVGLASL